MRFDLVQSLIERVRSANLAGERADRALAGVLRANRGLTSEERQRIAEWALGIIVWRGRLDTMAAGEQSLWLPLFLVERAGWTIDASAAATGIQDAVLKKALAFAPPIDATERLAFNCSIPTWLARRWIEQFGIERASSLAAAMNERGPVAVRANLLRNSRDELQAALRAEGVESRASALVPTGLVLAGRPNINALSAWREGCFEVQDEGSQLIAESVHARSGETVVDLCAGSGGKTLALAASMQNSGRLIAIEPDPQRLVDLAVRARRAGVTCIESRTGDARESRVWDDLSGQADSVLVDAPCSSLGTLRRGPDARWRLADNEPEKWAPLQRELLRTAAQLVRPGGRIVYATCSVDPVENEAVSRSLAGSRFVLQREHRTWPDIDGCDGFYWSVFSVAYTA